MLNKGKGRPIAKLTMIVTMACTVAMLYMGMSLPSSGIAQADGAYGAVVAAGGRVNDARRCRCVHTTGELRSRGHACSDSVANAVEVHRVWMVGDGGQEAWIIQSSRAEMCAWLSEVEYNFVEEPWIQDNGEGHLTEWLEKAGIAITPE